MKVRVFLSCLLVWFVALSALGQPGISTWRWAAEQPFVVQAVTADAAGNAYVAGQFAGSITLGRTSFRSRSDDTDLLVAKFSPQGRLLWATTLGAEPSARPQRYASSIIARDVSVNLLTGEVHVAAGFVGTISQPKGTAPLVSYGTANGNAESYRSVLVVKLSARGEVQWAQRAGNAIRDTEGFAIATDWRGNCYVTGSGYNQIDFDTGTAILLGSRQPYVFSLDAQGAVRWGMAGASALGAVGNDIAVDAQQGCYVVGSYTGTLQLGSFNLTSGSNAFIAKLAQRTGAVVWAKQSTSSDGSVQAQSIAVDALGNSFVAGTATDASVLAFDFSLVSGFSPHAGFVARFDATGTTRWVRAFGLRVSGHGVQVANLSSVPVLQKAVVAYTEEGRAGQQQQLLVVELDGTVNPPLPSSGPGSTANRALAVVPGLGLPQVRAFVAGIYSGSVAFGPATLTATVPTSFLASFTYLIPPRTIDWSSLRLFPNPAREGFVLDLPASVQAQVQLCNFLGIVVREYQVPGSKAVTSLKIDVRELPRGLYTLRVISGAESESRQVELQ